MVVVDVSDNGGDGDGDDGGGGGGGGDDAMSAAPQWGDHVGYYEHANYW